MKKEFSIFVDISLLVLVVIVLLLILYSILNAIFYFPDLKLAGLIASASFTALTVAYIIFWIKRFKK